MKRKLFLCVIVLLIITGCGKELIKEKELSKGLDNYINSNYNEYGYEASLNDGVMKINHEDHEFILKYTLKDEVTFTYETEIKKGISYEEYGYKTEALSLPMLGYIASAYTYGVDVQDSSSYFSLTYLDGMMKYFDGDLKYIVVDDAEGFETDAEIILTDDFGNKVIDYVKEFYKKDVKIIDEENETYTYELKALCEEDVCKLTSKLIINTEADFSKLKGFAIEQAKAGMYEDITPENADYHIELSIGQTMKINGDNLSGYELAGMNIVEVSGQYDFKAVNPGIANGYLHLGEEHKSIYITVTNEEGDEVKTIVIS